MAPDDSPRQYDLEDRMYESAREVPGFVRQLPHTVANVEDVRQLVRTSGSVGANYIEAIEALGKKDCVRHIKICRKQAKESRFFLRLVFTEGKNDLEKARTDLVQEATELMSILGSIVRKSECQRMRPINTNIRPRAGAFWMSDVGLRVSDLTP